MTASIKDRARKNLEASFIALSRPSLNEQLMRKSWHNRKAFTF